MIPAHSAPLPNPCSPGVHPWLKTISILCLSKGDQSQEIVQGCSSIRAVTHAVALRLCESVLARDLGLASEASA
jgi:hypothetical protein